MKHLLVILFSLPLTSYSQKVFSVDYPNQSDVKVYTCNGEFDSDELSSDGHTIEFYT